jgi:large subunit ribosomal protein L28
MAYKCYCCGKSTVTGNNVSHSNRKTRRTWKPNLKSIRIEEGGKVKKIKICTRCLRSNKVKKAV